MSDPNYISKEGLENLKEELNTRKSARKTISERIGIAKEQGDLSENFEYQDAKDAQGENERIIHQLEDAIQRAIVIEEKTGESVISLGTSFSIEMENGEMKDFSIVGASETDPMHGKISNESPLGKSFLGKMVKDTVEFEGPSGVKTYKIISIK